MKRYTRFTLVKNIVLFATAFFTVSTWADSCPRIEDIKQVTIRESPTTPGPGIKQEVQFEAKNGWFSNDSYQIGEDDRVTSPDYRLVVTKLEVDQFTGISFHAPLHSGDKVSGQLSACYYTVARTLVDGNGKIIPSKRLWLHMIKNPAVIENGENHWYKSSCRGEKCSVDIYTCTSAPEDCKFNLQNSN